MSNFVDVTKNSDFLATVVVEHFINQLKAHRFHNYLLAEAPAYEPEISNAGFFFTLNQVPDVIFYQTGDFEVNRKSYKKDYRLKYSHKNNKRMKLFVRLFCVKHQDLSINL